MKRIVILLSIGSLLYGNFALDYINTLRSKSGLKRLQYSPLLEKAARYHAKYLALNNALSHYESRYKPGFFGEYPWDRVIKAGFGTRVAVENISFYERNFKSSIDKLMGTVYHRLAFLDFRVDSIGFSAYKGRYVYDMSNAKIATLCKKKTAQSSYGVEGLCKNPNKTLAQNLYNKAILSTLAKSQKVSLYPYKNQRGVPLRLVEERPIFLYGSNFGFPITARFNNYYLNRVTLRSFELYKNNQKVPSRVVTKSNDLQAKIDDFTFVLVPLAPLQRKTSYKAVLRVKEDGKNRSYSWRFTTK